MMIFNNNNNNTNNDNTMSTFDINSSYVINNDNNDLITLVKQKLDWYKKSNLSAE